jgi:hypothetical protein
MGKLKDSFPDLDHGYYWVTRFAVILALLSLVTSVIIFIWDQRSDRILSMNVEERNKMLKKAEE